MSLDTNENRAVIQYRKLGNKFGNFFDALTMPIVNETLYYGNLSINTKSGLLKYLDKKPIFLRLTSRPYKVIKTLVVNGEKITTYENFAQVFECKNNKKFQSNIKSTIRDLRRRLGINRNKKPELDIFIPTGDGYKLSS